MSSCPNVAEVAKTRASNMHENDSNGLVPFGEYGLRLERVENLTRLGERHHEGDIPPSRAVDLANQKCTISREG
jgi:hypothetical protein